jgi:hypothetical protein
MNKVSLLLFFCFCSSFSLFGQTAYPLTFFWKAKIEKGAEIEILVSMIDSDDVLNGKGSRIRGNLVYHNSWQSFEIRGRADRDKISFNCYDSTGAIVESFRFKEVDFKKEEQNGEWTDGKKTKSLKLRMLSPEKTSRSLRDAFAEGVNFRAERLSETPMLKGLPHPILNKMGEGYLMKDSAFAKVAHYGQTYICFRDSVEGEALQLDWTLLQANSFYLLESQQIWEGNSLKGLALKAWTYRAGEWMSVDHEVFPPAFVEEKELKLPEQIESFTATSDQLVFKLKNEPRPMIWVWGGKNWQIKK